MRSIGIVVMLVLVAAPGCKKSQKNKELPAPSAPGAGASPKPLGSATDAGAPDSASAAADLQPPVVAPPVPPFAADPVSKANQNMADELASESMHALVQGGVADDPSEADRLLAELARALTLAPGHVLARYAFACILHGRGDTAGAAAQLGQLKQSGCADCLSALSNLGPDDQTCAWGNDPAIEAVRRDLPVSPLHQAAQIVVTAFEDGPVDKLDSVLDPKGKVKTFVACSVCSDGDDGDVKRTLTGAKAVAAWIKAHNSQDDGTGGTSASGPFFCSGNCCTVQYGSLSHNHTFIDSLCFSPGPTPKLTSVSLTDGG